MASPLEDLYFVGTQVERFNPTLLIGLGEFGREVLTYLYFRFKYYFPELSEASAFFYIDQRRDDIEEECQNKFPFLQTFFLPEINSSLSHKNLANNNSSNADKLNAKDTKAPLLKMLKAALQKACSTILGEEITGQLKSEGFIELLEGERISFNTVLLFSLKDISSVFAPELMEILATLDYPEAQSVFQWIIPVILRKDFTIPWNEALEESLPILNSVFEKTKILSKSFSTRCFIVSDFKADGSSVKLEEIKQALTQILFLSISPAYPKPLLTSICQEEIPPKGLPPCGTFGISSLNIPLEELIGNLSQRISKEILLNFILQPVQKPDTLKNTIRNSEVFSNLTEASIVVNLLQNLPLSPVLNQERIVTGVSINSFEMRLALEDTHPYLWPERVASFDASIRVKITSWMEELEKNFKNTYKDLEKAIKNEVDSFLQTYSVSTIESALLFLNTIRKKIEDFSTPLIEIEEDSLKIEKEEKRLKELVHNFPNIYSLFGGVSLFSLFEIYFIYQLLKAFILGLFGFFAIAIPLILINSVLTLLHLKKEEAKIKSARESILSAIQKRYSSIIFLKIKELLTKIQNGLLETVKEEERKITKLKEHLTALLKEIDKSPAAFSPLGYYPCAKQRYSISNSIIDEADVEFIYTEQKFNFELLSSCLIATYKFLGDWRSIDFIKFSDKSILNSPLFNKLKEFSLNQLKGIKLLPSSSFLIKKGKDNLAGYLSKHLKSLLTKSTPLIRYSGNIADAIGETFLIIPPHILSLTKEVLKTEQAVKIVESEKYTIAVLKIFQGINIEGL